MLLFLCAVSLACVASGAGVCQCQQRSTLTVTSIIPWIVAAMLLFLFYYHLMHNCDLNSAKNTIKNVRGRKRASNSPTRMDAVQVLDVDEALTPALLSEEHLPVKSEQFRGFMQIVTEFVIDYMRNTSQYKVTTDSKPGFIYSKFPKQMPTNSEKFSAVLSDIYEWILPGMAHWLHPQFHGYFPSGASYPDILAEAIVSSTGIAAFSWDSSPSFTELEVVMVNWLGRAIGLPDEFLFQGKAIESPGGGALQPTASDAVHVAVLCARYRKIRELVSVEDPERFEKEAAVLGKLVAYASAEAHTCIDKACNLAMVRLRSIPSSADAFSLRGALLEREVNKDRERGLIPFFIHATSGTTAVCAFDDLEECAAVAKRHNLWLHVDAAYAGAAMICPEFRRLIKGFESVDSINVNMHKMLLISPTSAFLWTKHHAIVRQTFSVEPLYLRKTHSDSMDFRNWGIGLSRRGKSLKLWFLFRMYGLRHLQEYIRRLVGLAKRFRELVKSDPRIELVGDQHLSLVCFHVKHNNSVIANEQTTRLCKFINRSRRLLVTHASPRNIDVVRICFGQERLSDATVDESWRLLCELLDAFFGKSPRKHGSDDRFLFEADRDFDVSPIATIEGTQHSMSQERLSDFEPEYE